MLQGVSPGECAVRMARAGAPIVGVNCLFDPFLCLETVREMKAALDRAGLRPYLMAQPLGYKTPDTGSYGWITLPDYPFGRISQSHSLTALTVLTLLSPGAAADHEVGGGQVCPRGVRGRGESDRRLLWGGESPRQGHG